MTTSTIDNQAVVIAMTAVGCGQYAEYADDLTDHLRLNGVNPETVRGYVFDKGVFIDSHTIHSFVNALRVSPEETPANDEWPAGVPTDGPIAQWFEMFRSNAAEIIRTAGGDAGLDYDAVSAVLIAAGLEDEEPVVEWEDGPDEDDMLARINDADLRSVRIERTLTIIADQIASLTAFASAHGYRGPATD